MGTTKRVATLALGSAVCALVTGVVALAVVKATLRSSDLAHQVPFLQLFLDPFVLRVWLALTFLPALIGFAFSLWALWNVQLSRAFPATVGATVIAAAVAAAALPPLSPLAALLAAMLVMFCCRYYEPWALPGGKRGPVGAGAA